MVVQPGRLGSNCPVLDLLRQVDHDLMPNIEGRGAARYLKPGSMRFPESTMRPAKINAAVSEVVRLMAPDVERIRYEVCQDWSDDWAIFFRVVLSDEASRTRLREITAKIVAHLDERLDFSSMQFQEPVRTSRPAGRGLDVADALSRGPAPE